MGYTWVFSPRNQWSYFTKAIVDEAHLVGPNINLQGRKSPTGEGQREDARYTPGVCYLDFKGGVVDGIPPES